MRKFMVGLVGMAVATFMATGMPRAQTSPPEALMRARSSSTSYTFVTIFRITMWYRAGRTPMLRVEGRSGSVIYLCEVTGDSTNVQRAHDKVAFLFGARRMRIDCEGTYGGGGSLRYTHVTLGTHGFIITSQAN